MRKVKLDDIRIDGGTQGRLVIDQKLMYSYLECMKEGDQFPRMFTVFDGATYWLVDGFHRYHAYKLLNIKEIEIDYKPGTLEEAQVLSFGVNGTHGKPRTNEDKRKVVLAAFEHVLTKNKSNYEIAKICYVSQPFVSAMRDQSKKEAQNKNRIKHAEKVAQEASAEGATTNPISIEVITPTAPEPNSYDGAVPDEDEIMEAQLALQADQEAMHKLLESDDALATAHQEIKRLNVLNAQLSVRINGLMNERNEAVKMVKKLQNEVDKLRGKK